MVGGGGRRCLEQGEMCLVPFDVATLGIEDGDAVGVELRQMVVAIGQNCERVLQLRLLGLRYLDKGLEERQVHVRADRPNVLPVDLFGLVQGGVVALVELRTRGLEIDHLLVAEPAPLAAGPRQRRAQLVAPCARWSAVP